MRQKDESISERSRTIYNCNNNAEKQFDIELGLLVYYLRNLPRLYQKKLSPIIGLLRTEYEKDNRVKEYANSVLCDVQRSPEWTVEANNLMRILSKLLQLTHLDPVVHKMVEKLEHERGKPNQVKKGELVAKKNVVEKVDLLLPDYQIYYRMSKQEKSHPLTDHSVKQRDRRHFYSEPRFIVKLDELNHFENSEQHRGNILFLSYQGDIIKGSKVYAVVNYNYIDIWEKQTSGPPPVRLFDIEEEDKEKKEKEDPQLQPGKLEHVHRLVGHEGKITSISFSSDEYFMISCGVDRTIKLWCLRLKIVLEEFKTHSKTVWDCQFSPSGYYFLSGGADGLMILWRTDVPNPQRMYNHKLDVYKVRFARDPSYVISAGQDCTVKIWKTAEAELHKQIRFNCPVINISLGFSGKYLATAETDGMITVIDLIEGQIINSFPIKEPQRKRGENEQDKKPKMMMIHDLDFSDDERQFTCVSSRYICIYSMDRLQMKTAKNIFAPAEGAANDKYNKVAMKEFISMSSDTNLTFCAYQHKNLLVVAGNKKMV